MLSMPPHISSGAQLSLDHTCEDCYISRLQRTTLSAHILSSPSHTDSGLAMWLDLACDASRGLKALGNATCSLRNCSGTIEYPATLEPPNAGRGYTRLWLRARLASEVTLNIARVKKSPWTLQPQQTPHGAEPSRWAKPRLQNDEGWYVSLF